MKIKLPLLLLSALYNVTGYTQQPDKYFSESETKRIEAVLSADDMMGRALFTPGIDKAADFIADELKKSGIQPINNDSYFQEFKMVWTQPVSTIINVNGTPVRDRNYFVLSAQQQINLKNASDYILVTVKQTDDLDSLIKKLQKTSETYLLQIPAGQRPAFMTWQKKAANSFYSDATLVAVIYTGDIQTCEVNVEQIVQVKSLKNVAGVLPGKSKKDEVVIFSAHYDHLGVGKPDAAGDSIFNGANDDASGTTAVIMLANYFAQRNDNERTLMFVTFTGEESGGFGSQYFSRQLHPDSIVAMFNIEMIGTESKWGVNSAFITGFELTNMGKILQRNLSRSGFEFHPDPYPEQQLFFRSDNATLAKLGVPAHTISTSKMDSEPYYHTRDDEIETLDLRNMSEIIKSIAISSESIVAGKDTPARVKL
jgi:hypothetical protein